MDSGSAEGISEENMATLQDDAQWLSPCLRELFLNNLDHHVPAVANVADSRDVYSKLLLLSTRECPQKLKISLGKAILEGKHPVAVFFDCIHPEKLESVHFGGEDTTCVILAYKYALDSLRLLNFAYGRPEISSMFGDPILEALLRLLDRAVGNPVIRNDKSLWPWMFEELLSVVSLIRPGENVEQKYPAYTKHTCHLLDYLIWVAQGRKDSGCTVQKPWETRSPAELRRASNNDLSRLPFGPSDGERRTSCQDTERLCRLAHLFNIVFNQYILATSGRSMTLFTAPVEDGMIKATIGGVMRPNSDSLYAGIPAHLGHTRPEVQAALHAFCCCEIKGPAQVLLEFFFGGEWSAPSFPWSCRSAASRPPNDSLLIFARATQESTSKIEFIHFFPKNVHTPVVHVRQGRQMFNMALCHTVAALETKVGEFILDPTASQFMWKEKFVPRSIYTQHRVDNVLRIEECVPLDPARPPTKKTRKPGKRDERFRWERKCAAEYVLEQVKARLPDGGLSRLIDLPEEEFSRQCRMLEHYLVVEMGSCSKKWAPR